LYGFWRDGRCTAWIKISLLNKKGKYVYETFKIEEWQENERQALDSSDKLFGEASWR
jgi:hypothetical protein